MRQRQEVHALLQRTASFHYEQDDEGTIFKPIPMSQEMVDLLQEQRQKFIEKYRRDSSGFHETAACLRPVPFPYCCKSGRCRPRSFTL